MNHPECILNKIMYR